MTGRVVTFLSLLFFSLAAHLVAEEPFRTYSTPQGKKFEGKAVGYEGANIYTQ